MDDDVGRDNRGDRDGGIVGSEGSYDGGENPTPTNGDGGENPAPTNGDGIQTDSDVEIIGCRRPGK